MLVLSAGVGYQKEMNPDPGMSHRIRRRKINEP